MIDDINKITVSLIENLTRDAIRLLRTTHRIFIPPRQAQLYLNQRWKGGTMQEIALARAYEI